MKFLILWSTKEKKNWRTLGSKTTVDLNNFNCMAQKPSQHQDIQICIRFVSGFLFSFSPFFFFFFFSSQFCHVHASSSYIWIPMDVVMPKWPCCNGQMMSWPNGGTEVCQFVLWLGLGTVHIWTGTSTGIGTWNSVPVPNGTFFRYFTLCIITKTFISVKK